MSLKTNYKDDVLDASVNTTRKYKQISNSDGTISLTDSTVYTQNGDSYGSADVNTANKHINSLVDGLDVSIAVANWTASGSVFVAVKNVSDVYSLHPIYGLIDGSIDNFALITSMVVDDEAKTLTFTASEKPSGAMTLNVKGVL